MLDPSKLGISLSERWVFTYLGETHFCYERMTYQDSCGLRLGSSAELHREPQGRSRDQRARGGVPERRSPDIFVDSLAYGLQTPRAKDSGLLQWMTFVRLARRGAKVLYKQ